MNKYIFLSIFFSSVMINTTSASWFGYDRAVSAAQKNSWEETKQMLTQLVTHSPDNPSLLYDTGVAAYHTKDFDHALAYFKRASDMPSASNVLKEQAHFNAGNTYVALEQLEHAVQEYERVLTLNPNNERARHNLEKIKELLEQQKQKEEEDKQKQQEQEDKKEEKKEGQNQQQKQSGGNNTGDEQDAGDSSEQQNKDQSGDAGNKNRRSSQQNQDKNSSGDPESSQEQESHESSDDQKDQSSKDNESDSRTAPRNDKHSDQSSKEHSEDTVKDEQPDNHDESQGKNEHERSGEGERNNEQQEQERAHTHPPSGDQSLAPQEQQRPVEQEASCAQQDQDTQGDASQEGLTARAAQERADRQPPMDAWLAQLLDEYEKHDGQLHKQMIKATVNKELAGKHGENCW